MNIPWTICCFVRVTSFHHLWTRLQISNPFAASKKCQLFQVFPCCCCLWELIQLLLSWKRLHKVYSIISLIVSLQERFHQLSNDLTTYFFLDFHDLVQRLRFSVFLLIDLFLKRTQRSWAKSQPRTFDDIYHHHFNVFRFWVLGIVLIWYLSFSPFGRPCVTGPSGPFTRTRGRGFATTCKWIAGKCCKNRSRDPSKLSRK